MSSPLSIRDYEQPVEFHIGDVVVKSWNVLTRHFPTFLLLVGIASLPSLLLKPGMKPNGMFLLVMILTVVLSAFKGAVVVFAAFQDLRGQRVSAAESLARGLARFLPVIGLSVLTGLVVVLGFLLVVIPGLIALAALQVAMPACVVERLGPIRSMSRSAELTSGYRWPILGVMAGLLILNLVFTRAIRAALPAEPALPVTAAAWVWQVLSGSYAAVFTAILYHDLRAVKEGIGVEQIAAVFD